MLGFLRGAVVFVAVLAGAAALGYASLVFWERSHPPRLPGFHLPVVTPALNAGSTPRGTPRS